MEKSSRATATLAGMPLKYISLVTLTFQNSALILIMHYSRIMPLVDGHRYFTSTAVFLNEVIKFALSLAMALYETSQNLGPSTPVTTLVSSLSRAVFTGDSWKLAIPAVLYTFQNSLQYIAVSNLDAATFQVTYQLKILTTALFSVTMLKRSLSTKKWISLVLLMAGVGVVQIPGGEVTTSVTKASADARDVAESIEDGQAQMNASLGLLAVVIACSISGLAGVYFEKVLKDSNATASLWVRNVQLSFYSLFPAFFLGVVFKDGADIAKDGFFVGYNAVVWTAIVFQALGGLIVALVVNYADNIAKNFATSISILLSSVASVWFFDFKITVTFLAGTAIVLYATYLYSSPDRRPSSAPIVVDEESRTESEGNESSPFLQKGEDNDNMAEQRRDGPS
ncbi:nucleotide-sugar transporter [Aulographum hederae CBS 113979]|uniref:Nucleotide-sugar transporter n=1 Tax=Aulographum hederae CBS 113979 TaxID=1176131 RepID=A0A6G1HFG7_9PEZI|nr:nucleotide-sugar transporter [Aulographum hederae CBS 113979]